MVSFVALPVAKIPSIFPCLLLALCLSSCSFRSALDDQGNVTMRPPGKLMRSQGIREFEKIKRRRKISHDRQYTLPVSRVARRLQKVIHMPGAEWEFVVFKDASPNAFALPGGKVGINTGLFKLADDDALLAAVLGHEISHATAAHARQRVTHAAAALLGGVLLHQALENNGNQHKAEALVAYALTMYLIDSLPLSRRQEYESDRIGAIYMAHAGYDPRKSIELWRRLARYHDQHGGQKPEFLRTHPHDLSRIRSLQAFMPIAMRHYRKAGNTE